MSGDRINDGGPAFPSAWHPTDDGYKRGDCGMSLRDYVAAKALPAVIDAYMAGNGNCIGTDHARRNIPCLAYQFADEMLKQRHE